MSVRTRKTCRKCGHHNIVDQADLRPSRRQFPPVEEDLKAGEFNIHGGPPPPQRSQAYHSQDPPQGDLPQDGHSQGPEPPAVPPKEPLVQGNEPNSGPETSDVPQESAKLT